MAKTKEVSAEEFVRVWQAAANPAEVAKKLGTSVQTGQSRASRLRRHGIPLKKFPTGSAGRLNLDVPALKKLAEECLRNGSSKK